MLSEYAWFVAWEVIVNDRLHKSSSLLGSESNEPHKAFSEAIAQIEALPGVEKGSVLITAFNRI